MAKRNLTLFRKTTREPEVLEEAPAVVETQAEEHSMQSDDYASGLDDLPPDYSMVKPLSVNEKKRLKELEGAITANFGAFYAVGCALREIRAHQLYRGTHKRFDYYCKDLWEMQRAHAYRMIDAVNIVDDIKQIDFSPIVEKSKMSPMGDKIQWVPKNERQARALMAFKDNPEAIKTIVTEAVQTAPDGKITASHIKKTARRLHFEKVRDTVQKAKKQTNQAPKIAEDFRRAFQEFLDAINIERASEYRNTDQKEVIKHVRVILHALEAEL